MLRKLTEADREDYLKLKEETSLIKENERKTDPPAYDMFKINETDDKKRSCFVIAAPDGKMCGYCAIKDTDADVPEVEIELFEKYRQRGIGYEAMFLLLEQTMQESHKQRFRYCLEPDNFLSRALVKKLGGMPAGLKEDIWLLDMDKDEFMENYAELIDPHIEEIAEEFGVEARQLLVKDLCYEIDGNEMKRLKELYDKTDIAKNDRKCLVMDRKIAKARRKEYLLDSYHSLMRIQKTMEKEKMSAGSRKELMEMVKDYLQRIKSLEEG